MSKTTKTQEEQVISGDPSDSLYITRGVPHMLVEVLAPWGITAPVGHKVTPPGDYSGGDQIVLSGPTAHMYEARGMVKILGVAPNLENK